MATKSISQLDSAVSLALGDLFEIAEPDAQSQTGYASKKISLSQEAAFIQENVESQNLNTTNKTLVGAINEVKSDITSAINDLDVANTSIGQGETLATIKEENGKIAVTKQNIKINQGQIDNTCVAGTQDAITSGESWHKVASATITGVRTDCIIMLAVNDTYLPDEDSSSDSNGGILYCRVRQAYNPGLLEYAKLKFVANSGLDARSFRLYCKITTGTSITFEIWTSLTRRYSYRRFTIINQGQRTGVYQDSFTLHNSTTPTVPPTETATCIRFECEDNICKQAEIAPSEYSDNASQAYAIGDYMIWKGGFYKVTAAISASGAITEGTNVTQTTIGAELKAALNA